MNPSPLIQYTSPGVCTPSRPRVSQSLPTSIATQSSCIVQSLRKVASMPSRKNILKQLDYDKIKTVSADFLPPQFDHDVLFVLPPIEASAAQSKARSMEGMNKRYDGHIWTKTMTTNITNNLNLTFRSSSCIGHLHCENPHCKYFQHTHRASSFNEIEFDGFSKEPFLIVGLPLLDSRLFARCARSPPSVYLCAKLGFFTVIEITQCKGFAFISVNTNTLLGLATTEMLARRSMR